MGSSDTLYSARFELPDLIERGKNNALKCRVYRAGALVAPSSGTVSIYDTSTTAVVSAAAVTVSASVATYTLSSALVTDHALEEGWRVEWSLVMPDGVTHVFRNDAALVRGRLYPSITEADLYRVASSLNPAGAAVIHSETSFADKIDEAFVQIENRLIAQGNRPNLVLSPSAFRESHIYLALALIFEDFASRLNEAYEIRARMYREMFEGAWGRLRFVYDTDDDGVPDDGAGGARRGGPRSLWLTSRGDS